MPILLLIFIIVPLAEIAVFIKVGEAIGLGPTIAIVIITAIVGTALLRSQGFAALARAQDTLAEGRIPVDSVIDAVSLLTAGAFLLTPGMITDTLGFLLFIPAFRHGLAKLLMKKMASSANIDVNVFTSTTIGSTGPGPKPDSPQSQPRGNRPGNDGGPIIDAEFEPLDDPKDRDRT